MAVDGLLDTELSVPDPAELAGFWKRRDRWSTPSTSFERVTMNPVGTTTPA